MANEKSSVLVVVSESILAGLLVAAIGDMRRTHVESTLEAGAQALASRAHAHCAAIVHASVGDGGGWGFARRVRRWTATGPVLYVVDAGDRGIGRAVLLGCSTVRREPLEIATLRRFVGDAIERETRRDARVEAGVRRFCTDFGLGVPLEDVVRLLADGMTEQQIADTLNLSKRTAHGSVEKIRSKTGMCAMDVVVAVRELAIGDADWSRPPPQKESVHPAPRGSNDRR